MARTDRFRVAYVGGGSRFVVTLLHGLAALAEPLGALRRPVELALLDPDAARAGRMGRYAEITAAQAALPLVPHVTADQAEALDGADLVVLSAALDEPVRKARRTFGSPTLEPHGEHGPGVAIEAAASWPFVRSLAAQMTRRCPQAVLATIMNPTDVLAGAVEQAFGIRSLGVCVEAGALRGFLAYYLRVDSRRISLDHVGVNHVGWVAQWGIDGVADAEGLFWDSIPGRMEQPDWSPLPEFFVELYRRTGFMRSSPHHPWPFRMAWDETKQKRNERWAAACLPPGRTRHQHRAEQFEQALAEGRMIPEPDPTRVHPEAAPYSCPDARWSLGGLVLGLAGGRSEAIPLQVRNGDSHPSLPEDAWAEIPVIVEGGQFLRPPVPTLPDWLFHDTRTIALQRTALTAWLAGKDDRGLARGLLARPGEAPLDELLRIISDLHLVRDG